MRTRVVPIVLSFTSVWMVLVAGAAQVANTPSGVVRSFYELLHAKRYADGFRLSIYRPAIDDLKPEELRDLEPDFERLAATLPEKVEVTGEKISGDQATVMIKLPGKPEVQDVALMKVDGKWVIGEPESQKLIKKQGRTFFFNERMRVSEAEANEWLQEILGAELVYFRAKQQYTGIDELVRLGGISNVLAGGTTGGYHFEVKIEEGAKTFAVRAVPVGYGRTGRLSFYTDQTNLIRAEDNGGKPASATSPPYQPRIE